MLTFSAMQIQPRKFFLYALAVQLLISSARAAEPSGQPMTVRIDSVVPMIGTFQVKVFQSLELFYAGQPLAATNVPVTQNTVVFDAIPDGHYLISISHDANSDGRMNANAFGVPTESSAFYHPDPSAGNVRPSKAFFDLGATNRTLEVNLGRPPADPRAWGVGVLVLLSSNPYRGGDTVVRVFPSLQYVGEHFFIVGPRAGYNLFRNRWVNLNLVADVKFAGEAFEDEKFLQGMENRRDTVMAGFDGSLRAGPWRLEASAFTDVLDRHNGQEINLALARNWRGNTWALTPGAGLVWRSSAYNDYYYGVRANEATAERPAYDPGDSVEFFARLFGRVELSGPWSLLGSVRVEHLSDDVYESPIVDRRFVTSAFLGLNYAF